MTHNKTARIRDPQPGNIQLILFEAIDQPQAIEDQPVALFLEIPIHIITLLCSRLRKYLPYLGWCILGAIGTLKRDNGANIEEEGELGDREIYRYHTDDLAYCNSVPPVVHSFFFSFTIYIDTLQRAIDPEVIEQRSSIHPSQSGSTITRENFRGGLERDGGCVFSRMISFSNAIHIIPFARGNDVSSCFS